MKSCYLVEKYEPQKIHVRFSHKLIDEIKLISGFNKRNIEALSQWYEYIKGVVNYISFRDVAFGYAFNCTYINDDTIRLRESEYDIIYNIRINKTTRKIYVYVINIDLKLDEFGLEDPLAEGKSNNNVMNRLQQYINESVRQILNESQQSSSKRKAIDLVQERNPDMDWAAANNYVLKTVRDKVNALHNDTIGKFNLGVTRMFLDEPGLENDEKTRADLNLTLRFILSKCLIDNFTQNLEIGKPPKALSSKELIDMFSEEIKQAQEKEKKEVDSGDYSGQSNYDIVRIDSFEDATPYYQYTYNGSRWCLTYMRNQYDAYTDKGANQIYFCLKKGFKTIKPIVGENAPLDEYGLSMLSIIVDSKGRLKDCTTRWNHANGGSDQAMNVKQISEVVGVNFYQTFKPNTKWMDTVENALQRVRNGEHPSNVFDYCGDFSEGFALIELDYRINFIDAQGNLLSPKQWFDDGTDFYNGFAAVNLNDQNNWIDKQGKLLSPNQWFDEIREFSDGFAWVKLNGKENYIDKQGKLLSLNQWFDWCYAFYDGFALVNLNGEKYRIDTKGNFYDNETEEPIPSPLQQNESVRRRTNQRLMETRFRSYLNRLVREVMAG